VGCRKEGRKKKKGRSSESTKKELTLDALLIGLR
jgi:hypothetical protein